MAAYLLARIVVHDDAKYAEYRAQVPPVIAAHGGRYLVRGGAVDVKEGDPPPGRLVVVEFPDMASARTFYGSAEYAPLLKLRTDSTKSEVVFVEGLE
ncbi:MAG TPA: DUF1330 domain-containing protein [Acetobacteraceae bacterium]